MAARNDDRHEDRHDAYDAYGAYDAYDGDASDGMDALMAAITGEPLPEGALDDAAFAAEHRSALADVALLREQLGLIGETLAAAADGTDAEAVAPPGRPTAARPASGTEGTARPVQETDPETGPAPASTPPVKPSAASAPAGRPARSRPPGRRRPGAPALAFGTLAAAVAAFAVVGLGWLISQSGGADATANGASSAAKDGGAVQDGATSGGSRYVACARLVAEGTVAGLEPVPGTGQSRVTLDVERSYKPAEPKKPDEGDNEIVFPVDESQASRLHEGASVLVGIGRDQAVPDLLVTGDKNIAQQRSWIERSLPASASVRCE